MPVGNVRWYSKEKGYGFIVDEEDGSDVFLHISALPEGVEEVEDGARVDFSVVDSKRGRTATNIRILNDPPTLLKSKRKSPDQMVTIIEDSIALLDHLENIYRHNKHPDKQTAKKISTVLRGVARDIV
jgi:CspA family cold shock protein